MNIKYLIIVLVAFFYCSCRTDSATKSKSTTLNGQWELVEAFRSGKKTESLEGTYFSFTEDKMSTNLPIKGAIDSPYTFKEQVISQQLQPSMSIDYKVEELTGEQLKLSTNLRGLDFIFLLKKKKG